MPRTTSTKVPVTINLPAELFEPSETRPEELLRALFIQAYGASFECVVAETIRDAKGELKAKTKTTL